jgi:hypothetical protein
MERAYDLGDFIKACADPNHVSVHYDAKKGAERFNIFTEVDLLAFINSDGLEDVEFINTEVWHLNPNKPPDIYVDAYSFYSGKKYGYIAFMFSPKTQKWRIKSFKLNTKPKTREIKADRNYLTSGKVKKIKSTLVEIKNGVKK